MLVDFLKTQRTKAELNTALQVIRDFKHCEEESEWLKVPFIAWVKLEQLEEYLSHLVEGTELEKDTLAEIERLNK